MESTILEFANMNKGNYKSKMVLTYREVQLIYFLLEERMKYLENIDTTLIEDELAINRELKLVKTLKTYLESEEVRSPNINKREVGNRALDGITSGLIDESGEMKVLEEKREKLKKESKESEQDKISQLNMFR